MSCGCKNESCVPNKKKAIKGNKHQLKKIIINKNNEDEEVNIYPITTMGNVIDEYTGKRLPDVLFMHNHLHLVYDESFECTIKKVPKGYRRYGLWVTITYSNTSWETFFYKGTLEITCEEWVKAENWQVFLSSSVLNIHQRLGELEFLVSNLERTKASIVTVTKEEYKSLSEEQKKADNIIYYVI